MKITVMPMLGEVKRHERLDSLRGCHALTERSVVKMASSGAEMRAALGAALQELMMADRPAALSGKLTFILQVEID